MFLADMSEDQKKGLAKRFAPQWKFNAHIKNKKSGQNYNEQYFPMSVENFVHAVNSGKVQTQRIGEEQTKETKTSGLRVKYPIVQVNSGARGRNRLNHKRESILNAHDLGKFNASFFTDVEQELWFDPQTRLEDELRIEGYPKHMIGDKENAPTYYDLFTPNKNKFQDTETPWSEDAIAISYYLFYPYDTAGLFRWFWFFTTEMREHRSDWENITVIVDHPFENGQEQIHSVYYYGHFLPPKRVRHGNEHLRLINVGGDETHPEVYVSWGTHACYPVPGAIYDMVFTYDEFFNGDFHNINAWTNNLIDLEGPNPNWNNYVGMWGEDGSSNQGSALSPRKKGRWKQLEKGNNEPKDWEVLVKRYDDRFENNSLQSG